MTVSMEIINIVLQDMERLQTYRYSQITSCQSAEIVQDPD